MRAVIKEQMAEITDLQSENQELRKLLEEKTAAPQPAFLTAKLIETNREALAEDIKEAGNQWSSVVISGHQW